VAVLGTLLDELRKVGAGATANAELHARIRKDKQAYRDEWLRHDSQGKVNPAVFFDALRAAVPDDAIAVVDDGNHTYLTAELFPVHQSKALIVPTDFNAMGYAVPAAIGAKLANPQREVFAIVGDGAFTMTCMEIVSATRLGLGIVYYVFHDGELSQIAQAQEIPFNRKPCTALGAIDFSGVAIATGADYVRVENNRGACRGDRQGTRQRGRRTLHRGGPDHGLLEAYRLHARRCEDQFQALPAGPASAHGRAGGETQDHGLTAPPLKISSQGSRLRFPHPTEENHEKNHRFAGSRFLSGRHLGLGLPGRQSQG
jgi:hypothetical protein